MNIKCQIKTYIGCKEGPFKQRWGNHTLTFKLPNLRYYTKRASHIWNLKEENNRDPVVRWTILKNVKTCNNYTHICKL